MCELDPFLELGTLWVEPPLMELNSIARVEQNSQCLTLLSDLNAISEHELSFLMYLNISSAYSLAWAESNCWGWTVMSQLSPLSGAELHSWSWNCSHHN
jgi:hypothetical protein